MKYVIMSSAETTISRSVAVVTAVAVRSIRPFLLYPAEGGVLEVIAVVVEPAIKCQA